MSRKRQSAGLLMFRSSAGVVEVFLVHPGGPFFARRDQGSWTLPKGEFEAGEDQLQAARREFHEETGFTSEPPFLDLGMIQHKGGKIVSAWAFEGDRDPAELVSNTCMIEWPPRTGRKLEIPEVDRGDWFTLERAREYLRPDQAPLLDRLASLLAPTEAD